MDRRRVKLVVDVLLALFGAVLGMAVNYATSLKDHVPWPLRLLRDWSLPPAVVTPMLLLGPDRTALNPDDGRERVVVGLHDDHVDTPAWHPGGSFLATASSDRTARIRGLREPATDLDFLLGRARSRVFGRLTDDERRSFLLPPAPTPEPQR